MKSDKDLYTQVMPADLWKVYSSLDALFRGGGNASSSRLFGPKGVRASDFYIVNDAEEQMEMVLPDKTKGLSFSSSIERLQGIPIKGTVWKLPKGTQLPKGLVVNYKTKDHPLINVEYKMSVLDLMAKLKVLASMLTKTEVKIR